jgi:hypothetical protein
MIEAATLRPSTLTARKSRSGGALRSVFAFFGVRAGETEIVPGSADVAMKLPSSLSVAGLPGDVGRVTVAGSVEAVVSHTRTVESAPPETSRRPSGLNARSSTAPWWPRSARPWVLSDTSQIRMVRPFVLAAMRRPSGLNATSSYQISGAR